MNKIRVKLVSDYSIRKVTVELDDSIFDLKEEIAEHDNCDPKFCNLVLVRTLELLEDAKLLGFYQLENEEEIFVIKPPRYSPSSTRLPNSSERKITQKGMDETTKEIQPKNVNIPKTTRERNELLQRQVFISLIEITQNILSLNKTASTHFTSIHDGINCESVQESELMQSGFNLISKLMEMGFSREVAENVLICSNNRFYSAIDVLFPQAVNEGYGNHDNNASLINNNGNPNMDGEMEIQWLHDAKVQFFIKPMEGSVVFNLYRDYDRQFFRPFAAARERLVDMGFDESEVNEALRRNKNNEKATMDMIISRTLQKEENIEGVPNNSLVMKAILSNAEIQVGLLNKYSLLAILNIVDNHKNMWNWLTDPKTSKTIQRILSIVNNYETADKLKR